MTLSKTAATIHSRNAYRWCSLLAAMMLLTPVAHAEITGLETIQSIPAPGAFDWAPFTIDTTTYVAVASYRDDATSNVSSTIYQWSGANLFPVQQIATHGAIDWEAFTIDGTPYLAVANNFTDTSRLVDSKIYRWDGTTFTEFQSIPTQGAWEWTHFTMNGEHYLAVANSNNDTTYDVDSKLYRWDGTTFVEAQSFPTHHATSWTHFTIDGNDYLAVSNRQSGQNYALDSIVYRWNGVEFVQYQTIPTMVGYDMNFFSIGTQHYLAVANGNDGQGVDHDSKIYRWDGTRFTEIQSIPSHDARHWEHLEWNGDTYLALSNYQPDPASPYTSRLYRWDGTQFASVTSIPSVGSVSSTFLPLDNTPYLITANHRGGSTFNTTSPLYRLTGTLRPIAVATSSATAGAAPLTVDFDAGTSNDPDGGTITTYQWLTSDAQSASGATVSFTFTQPGSYSIQLTVTDDEGQTAQQTVDVQVNAVDATNCEGSASYSAATGELHLPLMDVATVPLLGGVGRPAGETTVPAEATLRIIPGTTLFEIQSVFSATPDEAPAVTPCHALYTIDGVLDVPRVDVPIVTAIGGLTVTTGVDTYHATLEQVPMSDLFQLTGIELLP